MKTTKIHLEEFKNSFLKRVDYLGLTGWNFWFERKKDDANSAWLKTDSEGRGATVGLNCIIDDEIDKLGKHEAIELLLVPLINLAKERFVSENSIEEAKHDIIRRLEKVLP